MKKLNRSERKEAALKVWERGICKTHTGKMAGMVSISTSTMINEFCAAMSTIKGSVCEHCYARAQFTRFPSMCGKYEESTIDLTSRVLSWDEIPVVNSANRSAVMICRKNV